MPTISKDDLFRAVLAMDVYHRGYNAGIKESYFTSSTQIGTATIARSSKAEQLIGGVDQEDISFYGQEYLWNGKTVIAYRGTDSGFSNVDADADLVNGFGIGAAHPDGPQARAAVRTWVKFQVRGAAPRALIGAWRGSNAGGRERGRGRAPDSACPGARCRARRAATA